MTGSPMVVEEARPRPGQALDAGCADDQFRIAVKGWIRDNAPPGLDELADWSGLLLGGAGWWANQQQRGQPEFRQWERALLRERLICAHWPARYGGRDLPASKCAILDEEFLLANVPRISRQQGEAWVGPSIMVHGTPDQRDRLLPPIVTGAARYGQGFSEPDHGSDLAGLQTRGLVDREVIRITGQKVWMTGGQYANTLFVLCRTDAAIPKHRGLTYVIVPLEDNAGRITIRPVRQLTGGEEFCEAFFDDAIAPVTNIIGAVGDGWRVAMTTLANERAGRISSKHLVYERQFWAVVEQARADGRLGDETRQDALVRCYERLLAIRATATSGAPLAPPGVDEGVVGSLIKLAGSEWHRHLGELAIDVLGPDALVRASAEGYELTPTLELFLSSRGETIASGTSEIQRDLLAERWLGLPRAPR